jgi:hypothetical protein
VLYSAKLPAQPFERAVTSIRAAISEQKIMTGCRNRRPEEAWDLMRSRQLTQCWFGATRHR